MTYLVPKLLNGKVIFLKLQDIFHSQQKVNSRDLLCQKVVLKYPKLSEFQVAVWYPQEEFPLTHQFGIGAYHDHSKSLNNLNIVSSFVSFLNF